MFHERVDPSVEDAMRAAAEAVAAQAPGCVDDLVLLERLLRDPDETVLRALGSRARMVLREVETARAAATEDVSRLPSSEGVARFAEAEAFELGGYDAVVGAVHVLLALFAFEGSRSEEVLRRCGLEWRPLRSVTRRLGLSW